MVKDPSPAFCPTLLMLFLFVSSDDEETDLSAVTPLLVSSYILCYTPFAVSEVTQAHVQT